MEKYIIAVDMDGTLLNSENKISERNRNVLQRRVPIFLLAYGQT